MFLHVVAFAEVVDGRMRCDGQTRCDGRTKYDGQTRYDGWTRCDSQTQDYSYVFPDWHSDQYSLAG